MCITGSVVSFSKVARSRRTEALVESKELRADTSSITPRIIPDFSKSGKNLRHRGGIFVGDTSKRIAFCGSKAQL